MTTDKGEISGFGRRLARLRKSQGLTQQHLANMIGVSKVTVCRWETETVTPSSTDIAKAVRLLDGDLSWVMYNEGNPPDSDNA